MFFVEVLIGDWICVPLNDVDDLGSSRVDVDRDGDEEEQDHGDSGDDHCV